MTAITETAPVGADLWKQLFGRAAVVAAILGSALAVLNQSDEIFGDAEIEWLPLLLLYVTPFLVVSLSQVFGVREAQRASHWIKDFRENFLETLVSHGIPARALLLSLAVGSCNTAIMISESALSGRALDQLPVAVILQAFALPALFGAVSQALALRRTIRQGRPRQG